MRTGLRHNPILKYNFFLESVYNVFAPFIILEVLVFLSNIVDTVLTSNCSGLRSDTFEMSLPVRPITY